MPCLPDRRPASHLYLLPLLIAAALSVPLHAQDLPGELLAFSRINEMEGGFTGMVNEQEKLGVSVTSLGDLDGDGIGDLAMGNSSRIPILGFTATTGAVWILFLESDGSVREHVKIDNDTGGFSGGLEGYTEFGNALAPLGDLDGDGVVDLAVGAPLDDDGGPPSISAGRGAVWILFLNSDGTVKEETKISATQGGFGGTLGMNDRFGWALAALGDLSGDGTLELAVGASLDTDIGSQRGAVWILSLESDGSVASQTKINDAEGGFGGSLPDGSQFGSSLANLGDFDGDGRIELAVGAPWQDVNLDRDGALWILDLDSAGQVTDEVLLAGGINGFPDALQIASRFGTSVAHLGDVDKDGLPDLAVGAAGHGDSIVGAMWIVFLAADGTVQHSQRLDNAASGLPSLLVPLSEFGTAAAPLGDFDGDGRVDVVVSSMKGFGDNSGLWLISLQGMVDQSAPACELTVDAGQTLATGSASDALPSEDTNGNRLLDDGEDLDGDDAIDADSGLASIVLADDATNLALDVDPFVPGAPAASFSVQLIDIALPGSGTVLVADVAGNETACPVNLAGAECFLVIGDGVGDAPFAPGLHLFTTQVGTVEEQHAVLMEQIPDFVLPGPGLRLHGAGLGQGLPGASTISLGDVPTWLADGEFTVQVLLWNPGVFPQQPEQLSHGLLVRVLPDGSVLTRPYGGGTGIEVWAETAIDDQGRAVVRFPFAIPGL